MTKREKIRKGIEQYTDCPAALWAYLHKNGLVLKVDREFPEIKVDLGDGKHHWLTDTIGWKYKEAGYEAVEPPIEEK